MSRHRLPTDYCPAAIEEQDRVDAAIRILRSAKAELEALLKGARLAAVEDAIGAVIDAWPSDAELYDLDVNEVLS